MKHLAIAALLLTACASSSDFVDSEMVDCAEMGNEVSVMLSRAQVETSPTPSMMITDPQVTIDVEVSNNSHGEIVVKTIVLHPRSEPNGVFQLNNAYGKFDQAIAEDKDHVFTLRTTGRWRVRTNERGDRPASSVPVEARVELANGQTYRCLFSVPVG